MRKTCGSCGEPFEAKRAAAKYCGERCRKRAQRHPDRVREPEILASSAEPTSDSAAGELTAATLAELEAAGRTASAAGQAALALARRIDHGASETGQALAAMVREHRAALAAAVADAMKAADPLDELRARRERKSASG